VSLKGQARRMINRAIMTFNRRPELADCPPEEFLRCVLEAAEIGLAIDGKLCYVIKYKSVWQVVPDYKGLVAVAKRSGQVKDVYAECVTKQDTFRAYRDANGEHLFHERAFGARNEVICAYSIVVRPDDSTHHEIMDITELNAIQASAPSKSGPWSTDINEMRKKTVIRRILKLYSDDPAMARAIELDDKLYEELGAAGASVSLDQQSARAQAATADKHAELRQRLQIAQQAQQTANFDTFPDREKVPVEIDPFSNPGQRIDQHGAPR
jgi:recombination protein RecT